MNALAITAVSSFSEGPLIRASVTLAGTPSGTLSFRAARNPIFAESSAAPHIGAGPYRVHLPHPALWYVWAVDNLGECAAPGAVWAGVSDLLVNEVGQQLRTWLELHKPGLDALIQSLMPDAKLEQVVYGSPNDLTATPAVLISEPRITDQFAFFPMGRELVLSFRLNTLIAHQDEGSYLQYAVRLAGGVMDILNKPDYETMSALPSAQTVNFCHATEGDAADIQIEEAVWVAAGTIAWSCRAVIRDEG